MSPEPTPRRRRAIWVLIGLGVAAALALVVFATIGRFRPSEGIEASGTIEAIQADVASKVSGRIVQLRVRDGDRVRGGAVLAVLERRDPGLNVAQARANLAAAQARLAQTQAAYRLQRDGYATSLAQARSGLNLSRTRVPQAGETLAIQMRTVGASFDQATAQLEAALATRAAAQANERAADATLVRTQADDVRAAHLAGTGDISAQAADGARMAYLTASAARDASAQQLRSADASIAAARATLAEAQANRRSIQIRQLDVSAAVAQAEQSQAALQAARDAWRLVEERRADVATATAECDLARSTLRLAENQLDETTLYAPFDGVILSHNDEVGDLIEPGAAVLTIADLRHPYLRVYVGEQQLPLVKAGTTARVTIDGITGRTFTGTVTEISNTAEFTPSNVQTKEQRVELVFGVKIQFADDTGSLKPGLPADAVILPRR